MSFLYNVSDDDNLKLYFDLNGFEENDLKIIDCGDSLSALRYFGILCFL